MSEFSQTVHLFYTVPTVIKRAGVSIFIKSLDKNILITILSLENSNTCRSAVLQSIDLFYTIFTSIDWRPGFVSLKYANDSIS